MRSAQHRVIRAALVLVVMLAVVLAACGGDTSSSPTPTSSPEPTSGNAPEPGSASTSTASPSAAPSSSDPAAEKVAAARQVIAGVRLDDPSTIAAAETIRFTDEGTAAAAGALAEGVTGDELWAATWIYASSGLDPAPLQPLLKAADPTVRAMAASFALGWGDAAGAKVLVALLAVEDEMRGSKPPVNVWEYAAGSLARSLVGPAVPAGADRTATAAAWTAWLAQHGAMTYDAATGTWSVG